jgi:hypothetical protein
VPSVPSVTDGVDVLGAVAGLLDTCHLVQVRLVEATAELARTGLCESLEGLPLDHWLRLYARMLGADAATLVTAADVLPTMPVAWELFRTGEISWGTARNIAAKLARYPIDFRLRVDAELGDTVERWDGLDGWSADRLLDAVDRTIYDLLDTSTTHKDEDRDERASYVAIQPSFDGRVRGGFDLDAVAGATVLDAFAAATPDGPSTTLGRRRAAGLVEHGLPLPRRRPDGPPGEAAGAHRRAARGRHRDGRRPRPATHRRVSADPVGPAGRAARDRRRPPSRADVDGARPLATSKQAPGHRHPGRRACGDLGPGCRRPDARK